MFCAFNIVSDALADPNPYALGQETYLLQKVDMGPEPWLITRPDQEGTIAFGKLEYFNYAVGAGFSFDFKGYDFGTGEAGDPLMPADTSYALIYYVDPGPGPWTKPPDVYVLGISTGPYVSPAKGKAKGMVGVDIKLAGSCDSGQIPIAADVSYPNGGKIWLVPAGYLVSPTACSWTTMTGWGTNILFETSLITYGFEPE